MSKRAIYWGIGISLALVVLGYFTFEQLMQFTTLLLGAFQ